MAARHARGTHAEPAHVGHHDVRTHRDPAPARGSPAAHPRPPGTVSAGPPRIHRLHPLDLPIDRHRTGAAGRGDALLAAGVRAPDRREPPRAAQHRQHTGLVAHRRQADGAGGAPQRCQRHGVDHDRGECGLLGRRAQPLRCRRHPAGHTRGGIHAPAARPVLRNARVERRGLIC